MQNETTSPARLRDYTLPLWVIAGLLAVLVAIGAYLVVMDYQRAEAGQAITSTLDAQRKVINNLLTDYQNVAYDNSQIDRIAEQQLIATEYTLQALQLIAIQNTQIIELLATVP